jgi:hypothetical protein
MDSLYYDGFDYRKESLDGPLPQTFEWIFDVAGEFVLPEQVMYRYGWRTEEERRLVWPSFPHWLESSDSSSQYCVLGKAGSGKSTLMAWISRDLQEQTVDHLHKWAGSRPVHIVTHFFFRPSADTLGRNFEGLLRSLLFQVLSVAPDLQTSVLNNHEAHNHGGSTTKWPVRALKLMLKRALHSAQQQFFCIFIDGVDEYQNEGDAKDGSNSLIDYLLELQQPEHIKLCLSSRPTVRKLNYLASISGTTLRLADLNRLDILTYVSQAMYNCDGLREPHGIVHKVCQRADGVFLWAVFAVQEMSKWADTEDDDMLLERLERMGTQLEEIFAYMLANVEHAHCRTLAFYLKVMKWSRMDIIKGPPSIALLVAAQEDIPSWSYKTLVERCELEERRIVQWSHGLLETTTSREHARHLNRHVSREYAWVPRSSQDVKQGGQRSPTDTKDLLSDWLVAELDHHGKRVVSYDHRRISWLHRSAFDFFFSPTSQSHTRQTCELLKSYNDCDITSALIQGYRRLMLTLPHGCRNPCSACLMFSFQGQARRIVRTVASAITSLGECHDDALDQLLTTILAWRHYGAHPEPISDYRYHQDFSVLYNIGVSHPECPCKFVRPTPECIKGNCSVRFDQGRVRRDGMMEQAASANDACNSIRGLLSEVVFWKCCASLGVSFSYMMRRSNTFHERQTGGVILACILKASQELDDGPGRSADSIRFDTHVLDQLQLWFNHHAPAPVLGAPRRVYAWTYMERVMPASGTFIYWLSSQISFSPLALDASGSDTTSHEVATRGYGEASMVAALTSVCVNLPHRDVSLRVGQLLAPWDIWVGIGHGPHRGDITIMMHVTELALINSTEPNTEQNDVASLRLMLGDIENGRIASHEISHDITWKICRLDEGIKTTPAYEEQKASGFDGDLFLTFAEDLLRDVHQNPSLPAGEKEVLKNAVCAELVQHAEIEIMRTLPSSQGSRDKEPQLRILEKQAEKAGKMEQERLLALLSDW